MVVKNELACSEQLFPAEEYPSAGLVLYFLSTEVFTYQQEESESVVRNCGVVLWYVASETEKWL